MPFTLAHAAAALPFRRTRLVISAVIVGTFAPDFEYFLEFDRGKTYGHTLPGAILLDLPLALAVLWLYRSFVRAAVVSLMPDPLRVKFSSEPVPRRLFHTATLALLILSVIVGIATHIAWDQFTHMYTWPYDHWSFLHHPHQLPVLGTVQNYKLLQHGSTLFGTAVLALWFLGWYRRTPARTSQTIAANPHRILLVSTMFAVATGGAFFRASLDKASLPSYLGRVVVTFIPLLWLQLIAFGIWLNRRNRLQKPILQNPADYP